MKRPWLSVCVLAVMGIFFGTAPALTQGPPPTLVEQSRAVLAQLDGEIALPGLSAPVEVLRDRWGIPHLYAQNQDDLFFAQGVLAAQDRLFQIDMWRRIAVGETAEVLGPQGLEGDRFARLVRYRGDMQAEWESYSPDTRQIATAFTRGINAYIDHLGDRLPIEFTTLGYRPKHWQPEDVLGRMSGIIMIRNFRNEIDRARLVAAVGIERARRLAPAVPPHDYAPAPELDLSRIDAKVLSGYEAATRAFDYRHLPNGSNNWVVDGTRSLSGKPLIANDPHRPVLLPSLRYLVHLVAPGWNVIGGGEPALPGVAIGHNERIAWGMTIVGNDQSDIYVEETRPGDPTQYRVGDDWQPMQILREEAPVRGQQKPAMLELRFTRHGPVIHEDPARNVAYALRWSGMEPGTAGYLGSLGLDRAGNWQQFTAAVKGWKLPSENLVYADVDGNIGWIASALTPIRPGFDGLLPLPGAAGKYEWQGFLPVEQYPQVYNPAEHYVATANHNILPKGYQHQIAWEWSPPYRYLECKKRLEAQEKFDLADFQSIQHDNTTLPGLALLEQIRRLRFDEPKFERAAELLRRWDGVLSRDAAAGPVYGFWLEELSAEFFRPHVPAESLKYVKGQGIEVLLAALADPSEEWFGPQPGQGRDRLLRETFVRAVHKTEARLSPDPQRWAWGALHQATLRHPLSQRGARFAAVFDLPAVPTPGDAYTPNAARHEGDFAHVHGASFRHVLDLADWDRGLATSTPGQSGQPTSPHYGDLLPLWAEGEYFPLTYSRPKVEAVTLHRLVLKPR